MKHINKLVNALAYLKDNEALKLNEDTFLTGYLDGSDKVYGFAKIDSELYVINSNSNYPIEQLDKSELSYIMRLSAPNIYKKILEKKYEIDLAGNKN